MKNIIWPKPGKYVIGVSGGVDSVVLLDILAKKSEYQLLVAHFDHGIRTDSVKDCDLVANLASKYNLPFESLQGKLGKDATEEQARFARYNFFNRVAKKNNALAIITAHHLDDSIETLVFNSVRGASRFGLTPFVSNSAVLRPLQHILKTEIITYARRQKLSWREDSTNLDLSITRNYIRNYLLPLIEEIKPGTRRLLAKLSMDLASEQKTLKTEIENYLADNTSHIGQSLKLKRTKFLSQDSKITKDIVQAMCKSLQPNIELDSVQTSMAENFIKTAPSGKVLNLSKQLRLISHRATVSLTLSENT